MEGRNPSRNAAEDSGRNGICAGVGFSAGSTFIFETHVDQRLHDCMISLWRCWWGASGGGEGRCRVPFTVARASDTWHRLVAGLRHEWVVAVCGGLSWEGGQSEVFKAAVSARDGSFLMPDGHIRYSDGTLRQLDGSLRLNDGSVARAASPSAGSPLTRLPTPG